MPMLANEAMRITLRDRSRIVTFRSKIIVMQQQNERWQDYLNAAFMVTDFSLTSRPRSRKYFLILMEISQTEAIFWSVF